jgi:hypothetical protein
MEATIEHASVKTHYGNRGRTTYEPVASYTYIVGSKTYEGHDIFPLKRSLGESWARSVAHRLSTGKRLTGYYNPADPQNAYLLKEATFFPYVFLLLGFMVVNAILFFVLGQLKPAGLIQSLIAQANAQKRFLVTENSYSESLYQGSVISCFLFLGMGIIAFGHFLLLSWPSPGWFWAITLVVYTGLYLFGLRIQRLLRKCYYYFKPGMLTLDCETAQPGQTVNLVWDQPVRNRVHVRKMILVLAFTRRNAKNVEEVAETLLTVENQSYAPNESIHLEKTFTMPTTIGDTPVGNNCIWKLCLSMTLEDVPEYTRTFILPTGDEIN